MKIKSLRLIKTDNISKEYHKIQEIIKYNDLDWEMKQYVSYHYYERM